MNVFVFLLHSIRRNHNKKGNFGISKLFSLFVKLRDLVFHTKFSLCLSIIYTFFRGIEILYCSKYTCTLFEQQQNTPHKYFLFFFFLAGADGRGVGDGGGATTTNSSSSFFRFLYVYNKELKFIFLFPDTCVLRFDLYPYLYILYCFQWISYTFALYFYHFWAIYILHVSNKKFIHHNTNTV